MKEALFYEKLDGGQVHCLLCPQSCRIKDGGHGICRGRVNHGGELFAENYARVTSVAMDPIEKKPLYHFHPGSSILSLGTYGCNLSCGFCQNYEISQEKPMTRSLSPEEAVGQALKNSSVGIAYTYNEPLIWFEYVLDTAREAKKHGLVNVLVTNGLINPEPLEMILEYIDAMNVDIKSIKSNFYDRLCRGPMTPVLETCRVASKKVPVEVTNLIIPGENDTEEEWRELASWIAENMGLGTPVHLSAYFPRYKLRHEPTPFYVLENAYKVFRERLHYVYVGNVSSEYSDTNCVECGAELVRRSGYNVEIIGLKGALCGECGADNKIVV